MKQEAFESQHGPTWETFEKWIGILSGGTDPDTRQRQSHAEIGKRFPAMYRQVCHHLAVAQTRRYSIELQNRLNQLALRGHQQLYRSPTPVLGMIARFVVFDFPRAFRARWRYMLTSALLFWLSAIGMGFAVHLHPELVFSLLEPAEVSRMEEMYDPGNAVLGRERASDTDFFMFGFYIYNNISIGFQTYAGGLLFGLGTIFYLTLNGLFMGAVASHLTSLEFTETFWPFVVGHSSLELTAIVIFGGIGLMLGHAAIAPGRKRRWHAIRDSAIAGMPMVYGGTLMLIGAAFIEAFWSSTTWPPVSVKYGIGAMLWSLLGLYLLRVGRSES